MNLPEEIVIREIHSFHEMDACVALQQSVWQFRDLDVVPRRTFAVARAIGGQILGAWDGSTLAGYTLAVPGVRDGRPYLHSQMLAVSSEYRNRHIGARLKFAQREDALQRGIDRIEWTFDPLQIKNAHFNVEKLGAIVRRYTPEFYGPPSSPAYGPLPTDRLHAEWWLKSARVAGRMTGNLLPEYSIQETVSVTDRNLISTETLPASGDSGLELLLRVRGQFLNAFSNGRVVLRFHTALDGEGRYLLGTQTSPE